jgi:hypothetical protein
MNKRELKQALNKGHMFTGAVIPLPQNERVLLGDMLAMIMQLKNDQKIISIRDLGELHPVIQLINNRLILSWVRIPDNQGRISDKPDVDFDESIILEIQEKIDIATKIVLSSIDAGNKIASDSASRYVSAKEVTKLLNSSKEPRIVSNVAARANGPQAELFFNNDIRKLGGIADAQKEFTNTDLHRIEGCRVIRWINDLDVVLSVKIAPDNPELLPFFEKLKFRIRTAAGAVETSILHCATFSESSFDIAVSIGYNYKRKDILHLAKIIDPTVIFNQARERIAELEES